MSENQTKTCNKCGEEKSLDEFHKKSKKRGGGPVAQCISCVSLQRKRDYHNNKGGQKQKLREYRLQNRERLVLKKREWREKNREKVNEQKKKYRENNKEKIKEAGKRYYEENKEIVSKKAKIYRNKSKERINAYRRRRHREDPRVRLRRRVSSSVWKALSRTGGQKGGSVLNFLPFSIDELKEHLESLFVDGMSWSNHGTYWHLDHIVPCAALPFDSLEHPNFLKVWDLQNLQPLVASENIKKGSVHEGKRHRYRPRKYPKST
jgi:hypothetical protein